MEVGAPVWARLSTSDAWFKGRVEDLVEGVPTKSKPSFRKYNDILQTTKFIIARSNPDDTDSNVREEIVSDMLVDEHGQYELVQLQNTLNYDPEKTRDLTSLSNLNEPAILDVLRARFKVDMIYTNSSAILLSVNPYKTLPIYDQTTVEIYRDWGEKDEKGQRENADSQPGPHIYFVSDFAFREMVGKAGNQTESQPCNQSILVSGESGAGKTFTTKLIMKYLADITSSAGITSIEHKVLQSNPLLESFGNARTLLNDNSSRFGKFIEVRFLPDQNKNFKIVGATIRTYLLEKARLVAQGKGERNFHCFYELLKGATQDDLSRLHLTSFSDYWYTKQSGAENRKDGVDDKDQYKVTRAAMDDMKFAIDVQNSIYNVVAALLHLGNITFDVKPGVGEEEEGSSIAPASSGSVEFCCELLGVDRSALEKVLCQKEIKTREKLIMKRQTVTEATLARDALAKTIYGALFEFIAGRVNATIAAPVDPDHETTFIGILDIFGFESMAVNSFEQLCINMANEHLQQHFNEFVFNDEQKLYVRENITWTNVAYPDNSEVMQLLDGKTGILALCDEQVLFPKSTDKTMVNKFHEFHRNHPKFSASHFDVANYKFVIRHFAGPVRYSSEGFLDKNRDNIRGDMADLIHQSKTAFLRDLTGFFRTEEAAGAPKRSTKKIFSLGGEFRKQITELMVNINTTTPHYVRCLKPNNSSIGGIMDEALITEQLRCNGVLEAVRVHQSGYPNRYTFDQFIRYYGIIVKPPPGEKWNTENIGVLCKKLAELILSNPRFMIPKESLGSPDELLRAGIQIGTNLVFMRKATFEQIELGRLAKQRGVMAYLLFRFQGLLARIRFKKQRKLNLAATQIQKIVRGFLGRVHVAKKFPNHRSKYMNVQIAKERYKRMAMVRIIKLNLIVRLWRRFVRKNGKARRLRAIVLIQAVVRLFIHRNYLPKKRAQVLEQAKLDKKKLAAEVAELRRQLEAEEVARQAHQEFVKYLEDSRKNTSALLPGGAGSADSQNSAIDESGELTFESVKKDPTQAKQSSISSAADEVVDSEEIEVVMPTLKRQESVKFGIYDDAFITPGRVAWRKQPTGTVSRDDAGHTCTVVAVGVDPEAKLLYVQFGAKVDDPSSSKAELESPLKSKVALGESVSPASLSRLDIENPKSLLEGCTRYDVPDFDRSSPSNVPATFQFGGSGYSSAVLTLPTQSDYQAAEVAAKVAKAIADHKAHEDALLSHVTSERENFQKSLERAELEKTELLAKADADAKAKRRKSISWIPAENANANEDSTEEFTCVEHEAASLVGRCITIATKSGYKKALVLKYVAGTDEFVLRADDGKVANANLFLYEWKSNFCSMLRPFAVGDEVMAVYRVMEDHRYLESWHHARVATVVGSTLTVSWIGWDSAEGKVFNMHTEGHRVILVEEGMDLGDRNKPPPGF